ncbi:MAG: peroxidase family protein [Planctomycetota bacterium]
MRRVLCVIGAPLALGLCGGFTAWGQVQVFRTIDGTDNNLTQTDWGSAESTQIRLTDANYADGLGDMITSPNARAVSNAVGVQTSPTESNALNLSSMFWQWGQFIDHDLDLTRTSSTDFYLIDIPAGDGVFSDTSVIPMHRSATVAGTGVTDPREFANGITAWLDGSMVYGSDDARAAELRSFTGGKLQAGTDGFMRRNDNLFENANDTGVYADEDLFLAGDIRANEQVGLTTMHEVFFRYHNTIADQLAAENPGWTDEELYQTARKIVGASVQKITYEEWLPAMLGGSSLSSYGGYDASVDPSISLEFSSAIFRFGHTMLNENVTRVNADGSTFAGGHLDLSASFFDPDVITEAGSLDAIVRGLIWQEANDLDTQVVEDVRSMLFGSPDAGGLDLLALNIQRGRDHGIGTFNDLRVAFGLDEYTSFAELTDDTELAAALASIYGSIDEVDMWIGLMSEDAVPDGILGETLAIAMIDQFERLRDGDRFFYQLDGELIPYYDDYIEDVGLGDIFAMTTGVGEFAGLDVFTTIPEPATALLVVAGGTLMFRRRVA